MIKRPINKKAVTILNVYITNKRAFIDDMNIYTQKKKTTSNILQNITRTEFCKVAGYNRNIENLTVSVHSRNKQS